MSPTIDDIVREEIATLEALAKVLSDEEAALRGLDYARIDRARESKESFDERLRGLHARRPEGTPSHGLRDRHRQVCEAVGTAARRNHIRLEACYAGIRGLVGALSGDRDETYAPAKRTPAFTTQPVLASTVE